MAKPNFLLGYGERLTEPIHPAGREMKKREPYSFSEARDRLVPMARDASEDIDALPMAACPRDEAVAIVTLHPEYLAKSFYPGFLLRAIGLETVASRPSRIKPSRWTKKKNPEISPSTDLFVAGTRDTFRLWASVLGRWKPSTAGADDLTKIEQFRASGTTDRLRPISIDLNEPLLEIVLHAGPGGESSYILEAFEAYLQTLDAKPNMDQRLYAGRLCFLPVRAHKDSIEALTLFSYVRVARQMPSLRPLKPILRSRPEFKPFRCKLPEQAPVDPDLRVAVFDGGGPLPEFEPWVNNYNTADVDSPLGEFLHHGASVTSALLFGPIVQGEDIARPYAVVDHYRVLDKDSGADEDLYEVLHRIRDSSSI